MIQNRYIQMIAESGIFNLYIPILVTKSIYFVTHLGSKFRNFEQMNGSERTIGDRLYIRINRKQDRASLLRGPSHKLQFRFLEGREEKHIKLLHRDQPNGGHWGAEIRTADNIVAASNVGFLILKFSLSSRSTQPSTAHRRKTNTRSVRTITNRCRLEISTIQIGQTSPTLLHRFRSISKNLIRKMTRVVWIPALPLNAI